MTDSTANTDTSSTAPAAAVSTVADATCQTTQAPTVGGSSLSRLVIYRQAKYAGGPTNRNKKKKPICPKFTITFLADNPTLDRNPARLGTVEAYKTKFMLKHRNKKDPNAVYMSEREFARAAEALWNDSKWISELNKFRAQTFDRVFRHDPAYPVKVGRILWSAKEDLWLEIKIWKHVNLHGDRLRIHDWEKISKMHEKKWVGEKIFKGENLAARGKEDGKGPSRAKETVEIRRRNASAIRAHFEKSALKKFAEKLIKDFPKCEGGEYADLSDDDEDIDDLSDDEDEASSAASSTLAK